MALLGSKLGAVTVAVNRRPAPAEIQYILDNADVRVILVGGEYVDVLSESTSLTREGGRAR